MNRMRNMFSCLLALVFTLGLANEAMSQANLQFSEVEAYSECSPTGELLNVAFKLTNLGSNFVSTGTPSVDIYYDVDGSGTYTAGDIFIVKESLPLVIPAGSVVNIEASYALPNQMAFCPIVFNISDATCACGPFNYAQSSVPYLNAGDDVILCNAEEGQLGCSEGVAGYSYLWTAIGDADIDALSSTTIANPTVYAVNLTTEQIVWQFVLTTDKGLNNSCTFSDTVTVFICPFVMTTICTGQDVTLSVDGTANIDSIRWTGPNGFTSTELNPMIMNTQFSDRGVYTAVKYKNGCVQGKGCFRLNLDETPLTPAPSTVPVCEGNTIQLFANALGISYVWSGPNGFTSFVRNPIIPNATDLNSGVYSVYVVSGLCASDTGFVNVDVLPNFTKTVNATTCDPAEVGTVVQNLTAQNGCDSVVTTITTLLPSFEKTINLTSCDPSEVGTVVDTLTAQNGCDSVVTTVTTLLPSFEKTINLTSCDPAEVGTVVDTLTAQNGCDSVVITVTTLLPSFDKTINLTSCNPAEVGTVVDTITAQNGCDSVVTTVTTLLPSFDKTINLTSCDPAEVGTVVDTLAAQNGCDSVVTTITTLLPSFDKTINLTSCDPADVGTVVETLTAQNGCDSVVTTITTLLPSYDYTINDVTCNPLDSGIVVLNLTTADGCDSIVTIITELTDDYINFPDTAYVQCDPATQLGDYCLPIPWADINGYDIYIDGVVYFDQPFICDLDSSGGYDFSVLINSTPPTYGGTNHILRDWFINGVDVVTTNFNYTTFDQLVTYLNSKDPDGMWTLEDDDRIEGGFPFTSSNYGTLSIFSIEIGALANINYNSGVTSKGSLLEDFTPGCHWVVIENLNNPLCGPDSIYVCVECDNPEPSIDVEKHTNGQDADLPIGPVILVDLDGETVQWTYYVTNNGNIPLIDINVTDDKEGLVCTIPFLAPGQSDTCYLSGDAIRGMYSNLATATGQPIDQDGDPVGNPVMDQDPSHYTGVYINVEKIADKDTVCAGEEVTYNLIVRMLGGAPGVQIRNIKIVDNNLVDTLDVSSPYFVGNDVGGNGFIEFADNDNNGVNDEEFLFEYTLSINSNNTNVANDRGDIYFVDGQGNEFFIGTVGNTDTVKVVVDPSKCASIGDFVWNDTDGDGQQGLLEPGIAGVTVNLLDGNGVQVNTTTTNSNGFYEFTGLTPGNYIVEFIMPGGVTTTPVNQGNDATDSDANQATGQTGIITLANGEVNHTIDAGYICIPDGSTVNLTSCNPANVGTTTQNLKNIYGCDSIVTTVTTLLPSYDIQLTATTCNPANAGTVVQNLVSVEGCDSIVTTVTTLLESYDIQLTATTCNPANAGTVVQNLVSSEGCDSIVTTVTTLLESYDIQLTATTCNPANAGTVVQNLVSAEGCDSIVTTVTTLLESYDIQLTATTCNPASAGTVVQNLVSSEGCDSIVTTVTTLLPSYDIQLTATTCNPANAGTVVQNLVSVKGCDSIVTTVTTLLPSYDIQLTATTCNPANAGTVVQNLVSAEGCDSIVTTVTTLLESYDIQLTATTCNPANAGTVVQNLVSSEGCDSIVTTVTTLLESYDIQLTATTCNPANAGTVVQNLVSSEGCDSIVTTVTTLLESYDIQLTATTCNPANAGTVVQNLVSAEGCDSIVTTVTTLLESYDIQLTATTCNPANAGTVVQNLVSSEGCDSIVTTVTTLLPSYDIQLTATTCNPANAGTVVQNLVSAEGCDSIVTTVTTLLPSYDIQLTATTCDPQNVGTVVQNLVSAEGCDSIVTTVTTLLESYDIQLTATTCDPQNVGTVVQNLVSTEGCDSIVTTVTTLLPSYDIQLTATTCDPQNAGTVVQNLVSAEGCDSIVTTVTTLLESYDIQLTATTCDPQNVGTVVQNLVSTEGCDSIVTTVTTLLESYDIQLTATTCDPQNVGTVVQNLVSTEGCDSIVTTVTTLLESYDIQLTATTCDPQNVGTVVQTFTAVGGCDSIVTTITTLLPSYEIEIPQIVCNPADSGITVLQLQTINGCDSIITIINSLVPGYVELPDSAIVECDPLTETGEFCIPIAFADFISGYDLLIDGEVYFDFPFICALDSVGGYDFSTAINSNPPTYAGTEHILLNWFINGVDVVGTDFTYDTFEELADFMNTVDPLGQWTAVDDNINGGFPNTSFNYGILDIFSPQIAAQSFTSYNSGIISRGTLIEDIEPGCHWLTIINSAYPTCTDSIYVCVECECIPDSSTVMAVSCNPADIGTSVIVLVNQSGCDSVVTTVTTLLESYDIQLTATTCDPQNVGTVVQNLVSAEGCDSIVTTVTTLLESYDIQLTATTCNPANAGTVVQNLVSAEGCDSIVTTVTTLLESYDIQLTATTCDPQNVGTVVQNLVSAEGCDSIVTTVTTLLESYDIQLTATTCNPANAGTVVQNLVSAEGCDSIVTTVTTLLESYDIQLTATTCNPANAGTVVQNLVSAEGCDSIVTTVTTLLESYDIQLTATTCNPANAGTVVQNLVSAEGCDSIVTTVTTLLESYDIQLTATTCDPQNVGTVVQNLVSAEGCDSIVTTVTTLLESYDIQLTATTCNPANAGTVVQNLVSAEGCDSIVTTVTTLLESYDIQLTATTCDPQNVGTVVQNLVSAEGCDSIVTTVTTLLESYDIQLTATTCDPQNVGTVVQNLVSAEGCDSIVTTVTTLLESYDIQLTATTCDPQNVGTVVQNLVSAEGCDSIVTTVTTLLDSYDIQLTATTCDPQNVGTVVQNLVSVEGCDSIVTTVTTLLESYDIQLTATTCNPANAGTVVQNLVSAEGCDSIVTTVTTLLESYDIQLTATTCDPQNAGTVVQNLVSAEGCDSIVTTVTTLLPSYDIQLTATTCDPQNVGTVVQNLVSAEGCDSIVTTVTTLLESYDIQLTATTCDPQNAGTVVQNLVSVEGCDSIVTTVTTLLESYDIQLTATTCDPQNVGTVVQNLVSVEGCDSIVTTVTTLLPSFEITLTNEVCNPADSGTSVLNLTTIDGCDSVITIINVLVPGYIELPDTASGVCTDPVNQVGEYCIPIAFADFISGYDLLIDGEVYFDLPFICDVDSIGGYDFTTVINSNPSTYGGNTHILLSWEVNDVELVNSPYTYSTFTELASYLAGVDPQGNWTAIGDRVEGGFPYTNSDYGTVVVFSPQIGAQSFVNYNSGIVGKGTLIEDVPVGCHWFTLVNLQNPACTDSIYVCIECPDPAVTDTIYITVPIDEPTEELCGTGDDIDNTESSESLGCDVVLLEGSTITTGATGCITYTAGNVPGNFADTLCVVAHDGLGGTDTTVYIVTVIPKTDTIITPPDTVCIDFVTTVGGTVDTVYSCNGDDINVITDTLGCEVAVDVSGIVDGDTLCVVVCSGAICDTTIIIVTPIPPVTDTIYLTIPIDENTGELCGTGDDLDNTESSESLGCDVVLLEGSTITTGATGCITYTAGNVPGNFADTLCVVAHDGLGGTDTTVYIVTVIPKTDTIITPPDTVCIDFVTTVGGTVDTVYSCNGDDINVITDTLGCDVAVDVSGIVDGDTLCVVVCSGAICDTTIIIVTPIPPATDTIYLTIPIDENTGELCGTGDDLDNTESSESLGCDVVLLEGSTITTGATGCITYTAGNVPGNFADTLCVVAHDGLGGTDTTVYIVTVIPITDTIITPPDTVCIDFVTTVGGTVDTVYSCNGDDINVITDTLGCEVAVDVSGIVDGDTLCVVVCSGAICDTTIIIVTPIPPATDTIYLTIPIDENTGVLCGTGDDIDNTESSESLGCDVVLLEGSTITTGASGCITYTAGNVPGNFADTLCVVAHDGLGGTDTTVYIVTVIPKTDTIITPPDTVCIDFVTTVGGTVDTVYSCNGDDINVITDTLGCEVAVDVSGIVDGDTLCVVVCSGAICDTTIIIVTPIPPATDTIYLTIPIDENTGELCGTGDDLDNTESSESLGCDVVLLEGSTITTGATGCITYTAGNVPGNFADTLCVVAHDGLGGTDTTVYIVTVIPKTDTIITPPDTICIDFVTTVGGTVDTVFSCNGDDINVITDTLGCDVAVDVSGIVEGDTLCVVVCSGAICDTTIIIVTPIPPVTDTIYLTIPIDENTGELCGTGDDLDNIESSESLGCDVVLLEGSTIATGATGCITYTAGNVPGNFADTLCVVAHDGLGGTDTTVYIVTVIPKTDTIITPPDTVCIDFVTTVGGTVDTVYSCNGDDINVITDTLGCEVAVDVSGIVDGDTLCVVVCSGAICDTTIIIVTPIPPATDTIYLTIPIDENTGELCGTGDDLDNTESSESLGCDVVLLEGSTITTGATGCITYTAGNVPGNFADTLCVVAHDGLGGTDTTVYIVTVIPKTDTIITPPDTVCIDFVTTVGGTVDTVYSCNGDDINVITDTLGCEVAVDVSGIVDGDTLCVVVCSGAICDTTIIIVTPIPPVTDTIYLTIPIEESTSVLCGTGDDIEDVEFSVALNCDEELLEGSIVTTDGNGCVIYSADTTPGYFADTICIIAVDALGNTDTTVYIISVVPVIDTIIVPTDTLLCLDDVITVGGPVDTFYTCNGTILNIDTTSQNCEVIIVIDDNFTNDTTEICIVTCSGPICDTTIVIVINEGFPPVAVDDYDTTSIDVPVVISVLENDFDLDNDSIVIINVVTEPINGVISDIDFEDGTITYDPNPGYFGTDSFQYVICDIPQDGCDTAWVYVTILEEDCLFPQAITPNGDGQNDFFEIRCLAGQPSIELRIFNRWGNEVYFDTNYQNNWIGDYDGDPLPDGAYYYVIEYNDVNTNQRVQKGGYIMIHR